MTDDEAKDRKRRVFGSHPADEQLWRRLGHQFGLCQRGVFLRRELIRSVQESVSEWARDVQSELPADPPVGLRVALAACLPPGWDWWHGLARHMPIDRDPDIAVQVEVAFGWREGVVPDRSGSGWLTQAALIAPIDDALVGVASVLDGNLILERDDVAWEISEADESIDDLISPGRGYVVEILDSSTILFTAYTLPNLQEAVSVAVQPVDADGLAPLAELLLDEALKGSRARLELRRGMREKHPRACGTPDELMLVRHFVVSHWPKVSSVPPPTQGEVEALCDEIDLLAPWRTIGQRPDYYDTLRQADDEMLRRFETLLEEWELARSKRLYA